MTRRSLDVSREPRTLREILAAQERLLIVEALARCGGSRTRAAAALGIDRRHLYRRVRYLKIDLATIIAVVGRPAGRGGTTCPSR